MKDSIADILRILRKSDEEATQKLFDRLSENEEIAQNFFLVEKKILSILNFRALFEELLSEIREKFNVPYVWLSIIEKSELSNLIQSLESSNVLKKHLNLINRSAFAQLVGNTMKPILVNSNLKPYFKLFPRHTKYVINSLAITPISCDGEMIGSLNQADISKSRFHPGLDTSLLEHLAVKMSLCLSNVAAHEKLKFLANRDPLTGLLNRRVMEAILTREFVRAIRYEISLAVAFIDIDDFKGVNDTYGHDGGDDLLNHVAEQLMKISRETDVVARFAGDEFVVILPQTSATNAKQLMSRLVEYFSTNPFKTDKVTVPASISFGVASTEDKSIRTPLQLIKNADQNLYLTKRQKKKAI
jgi:diguanylate cyclase (GGDEF)-like protein